MELLIEKDSAAVAVRAADIITEFIPEQPTLGLATGSTPVETYRELIQRYESGEISFAGCRAFLLDEYVGLPHEHVQSYYQTIRRDFTRAIDIADEDVHSPNGAADDLARAAADYEAAIEEAGGVDVQILGIGTNGHIGFNEPGSSLSSLTRKKALHPQTVQDNARFFAEGEEVPRQAITQGLGTIMRARRILLLATGAKKAPAVAALAEGPVSAFCPASVLQWHRYATIIVDEAAAGELKNIEYYRFAAANR